MKNFLPKITLVLVLSICLSFTDQKEEDKIHWSPSRPLVWEDFKGKPDHSNSDAALTFSEMNYKFAWANDSATINLECYFDKTKSWVKADKKTDYLLKHEQGHFDLTEIYFRSLVKQLQGTKFYAKTFQVDVRKLINTNSDALNKEQDLYDKETNHSIIEAKQHEWDARIASRMKELQSYTALKVSVKIW